MGPTAAGKTAVALELATRFALKLISVDSMMVYRGLNIGTAKPKPELLLKAPHALIDIREFWEPYSAQDFCRDATLAIANAHAQGRLPILVGGTGLYFRALEHGLSDLPARDQALRDELQLALKTHGVVALHARLAELDPVSAARIHAHDPQRITRALEVIALTGKPFSSLLAARKRMQDQGAQDQGAQDQGAQDLGAQDLDIHKFVLSPASRALLHERIGLRTLAMFEEGLVAEVGALMGMPRFDRHFSAFRAVGYRQVIEHLDGAYDLPECRQRVLFATRQYAKRQLTWLRAERNAVWIEAESAAQAIAAALKPSARS